MSPERENAGKAGVEAIEMPMAAAAPERAAGIRTPDRPEAYPPLAKVPATIPGTSGIVAGIKAGMAYKRKGLQYFVEQMGRYGKIFRHQLGPYPVVVVGDHEVIVQVLKNEGRCWSTALAVERVTRGLSLNIPAAKRSRLMSLDFEAHRQTRNLVQPAFSSRALSNYLTIIEQELDRSLSSWPRSGVRTFRTEARRIFSRLAARLFFGIEDPGESARIETATRDYWQAIPAIVKSRRLNRRWRRGLEAVETLSSIMYGLIPKRRVEGGDDLFSQLCRPEGNRQKLDDDQLVDLMFGMVFAAFDTTTMGLTSMVYLLAKHPDWQETLRAEAMQVPEHPTLADLNGMEQTERVWKETLRMYPVSAISPRVSLRECRVGPYMIPSRTLVFACTGLVGLDPALWAHPERFDPARFASERAEQQRHDFLPFGLGAHSCIGSLLATLEIKLFWHLFLTRYRFRLAEDYQATHELTPLGCVSGGVNLRIERLLDVRNPHLT
ncbi:MAG TPA: cytochrome P450 [Thermoanaerobaculia bacterium]